MLGLNADCFCAIDLETTGLNPYKDDILEICILPLDHHLNIRKDIMPFQLIMQPEGKISEAALVVNGIRREDIAKGIHKDQAILLFHDWWVSKLNGCKITPIGHNYLGFDKDFLIMWLGKDAYNEYFAFKVRDTMAIGSYINDMHTIRKQKSLFPSLKLTSMCDTMTVPYDRSHRALDDCVMVARLYKKLIYLDVV